MNQPLDKNKESHAALPQDRPDNAPDSQEINALVALFNAGQLNEAAAQAQELAMRFPGHWLAWKMLGVVFSRMGRSAEALVPMQKAAALLPLDAEAHYNLGITFRALGRLEEAEASIKKSLGLNPGNAVAHNSLGNILQSLKHPEEAAASYQQAIQLRPDHAEAHYNLGNILYAMNRLPEAEASFRNAIQADPDFAEAYSNLGITLKNLNRFDEAKICLERALTIEPGLAEMHNNLGIILGKLGQLNEAQASYHRALQIKPDFAEALGNLGATLKELGCLDEAETMLRQALQINPYLAEAHNNLGMIFNDNHRLVEAETCYRKALEIKPDFAEALSNLGVTLLDIGKLDEAETCFRKALQIKPDYENAFSNLLFALNYHPDKSAEEIFETYREYDTRFGLPKQSEWQPHDNSRETGRRLKVGYVSPDFRKHSARHFLEPLLAHHDKQAVEVYAYAELTQEDAVTARYKHYVDHWIPTCNLTDSKLAGRIRADGIDILVELAGHTARNRLGVFARKPAPVSLSWMGYGYSTGLTAIDYFLTDETIVPAGNEKLFSEKPWRMTASPFVFRPAEDMGEPGPSPASSSGYITFGSMSRGIRINHRVIRVWAEILKRVENAQLVIDSKDFRDTQMQDMLVQKFATHGISHDRLKIGCHSPPWDVLRGLDIGLDCFPHNSGTTLFEALYMGVPFVTLSSRPSVGRLGSSILKNAGHPEWIAKTENEYVEKAVALAKNFPKLAALRNHLRQEMQTGPLMDEPGFARAFEAAYREMFEKWAKG